jgi:hypothetical protein
VAQQTSIGLKEFAQVLQARQKQVQGQMQPPTPFQTTAPSPVQQAMAMGRPGSGLASPQQQQQQNQQQQRLTQQLQQQNNPSRPSSQPQQTAPSHVLFHLFCFNSIIFCIIFALDFSM